METITAPKTAGQIMEVSEQWRSLTPRQRMWMAKYSDSRDAVAATRATYRCKSELNARLMSYEIKKHKNIRVCIALLDGKTERDIFIDDLRESIRRAVPGSVAQLRGQALFARMVFADKEPEDSDPAPEPEKKSPPHKFRVGQIVLQDGVSFRITAVSADGAITTAEETQNAV